MMDTKRICAITKVKEYLSMDRKKYWNEEYTKYWKNVTNDANEKGGDKTKIIKSTSGDYKSVGEQVADLLFAEMNYDKKNYLIMDVDLEDFSSFLIIRQITMGLIYRKI